MRRGALLPHVVSHLFAVEEHDELLPPEGPEKARVLSSQLSEVGPSHVMVIGPCFAIPPRGDQTTPHPPQWRGAIQFKNPRNGPDGDPEPFSFPVEPKLLGLPLPGKGTALGVLGLAGPAVVGLHDERPGPITADQFKFCQFFWRPALAHGHLNKLWMGSRGALSQTQRPIFSAMVGAP